MHLSAVPWRPEGALTPLWHEHWEPNLSPGQDQAVLGTADYVPAPVAALLNDSYTTVRATIFTQSRERITRGSGLSFCSLRST